MDCFFMNSLLNFWLSEPAEVFKSVTGSFSKQFSSQLEKIVQHYYKVLLARHFGQYSMIFFYF